ncbi:Tim44 domain-containing protein [Celerinatantimonas sp. YJH-8]|uniref:Tim44 domain-containing protein n=1 Tax=Celerinatantimonas sp. YJH-8 TaxID=3228714 RepID=UPI0038C31154
MTLKRVTTLLIVAIAVMTLSLDASARKFGGGKSWGKSYKTAPQQSLAQRPTTNTPQGSAAANSVRRPGIMGGLLGGLLAGGLFAWLLGSGAFSGLQFMDIAIMAVIAFILFRIFRSMMQAKAVNQEATSHGQSAWQSRQQVSEPVASSGTDIPKSAHDDVPYDLPAGFDVSQFLEGARGHYNIIQTAWNQNDLATIREYLAPELYQQMVEERHRYGDAPLNNHVLYVDASLVRASRQGDAQQISVQFIGKYRDETDQESAINEIWHLRRDSLNSDWLIEGIEEHSEV